MRKNELHELAKREAAERIANLSNQTANTIKGSTVTTNNTNTSGENSSHNRSQSNALTDEEKALNKAMLPSASLSLTSTSLNFSRWSSNVDLVIDSISSRYTLTNFICNIILHSSTSLNATLIDCNK